MDSRMLTSITRLDGKNYHDWKFAVGMLLCTRGCWGVVSGDVPKPETGSATDWKKKAEEGMTMIALTVNPSQYTYIRNCQDGAEAWKALQDIYERNSRATRIALKRQFYGFTHDVDQPVQTYVGGIIDLATKLRAIGLTLPNEDIIDVLIFNLAEPYSNIAASLATKDNLKLSDATSALVEEERRQGKDMPTESALVARGYGQGPRGRGDHRTCYRCGRTGHIV